MKLKDDELLFGRSPKYSILVRHSCSTDKHQIAQRNKDNHVSTKGVNSCCCILFVGDHLCIIICKFSSHLHPSNNFKHSLDLFTRRCITGCGTVRNTCDRTLVSTTLSETMLHTSNENILVLMRIVFQRRVPGLR